MRPLTALLLFLCAAVAAADDHVVEAGKIADLKYDVAKGDKSTLRVTPAPLDRVAIDAEPGRFVFVGKAGETYRVRGYVINFKTQKFIEVDDTVTFGGKAPDVEPGPEPKPKPDPAPAPVTSFHVVVVYESMATLTAKQHGVLYSGDIRAYLDAATTPDGATKGWRLRDKDLSADNDTPTQKQLWAAIRPQITTVPCWAVEVNGKVEIVPLPGSVAEGLATLRKYKGEK